MDFQDIYVEFFRRSRSRSPSSRKKDNSDDHVIHREGALTIKDEPLDKVCVLFYIFFHYIYSKMNLISKWKSL
jgi:hypothetical protein